MAVNKRHRNGVTMSDSYRKRAFGLRPEDKWPDEGMAKRDFMTYWGLVTHWVEAKGKGKFPVKRAMAECPTCRKHVEAGHLGQHMSAHKEG